MDLRRIAELLGGIVVAGQVRAPAPSHSAKDRSMIITPAPMLWGELHVRLWSDGDPLAAKAYVLAKLGLPPFPEGKGFPGPKKAAVANAPPPQPSLSEKVRTERALSIWYEARGPHRTPVETYLTEEPGLKLPPEAAGVTLRYHPSCPFGRERTPAMVALVRDIVTNAPVAIHRTALNRAGQKMVIDGCDRLTLGPAKGGAIKLTPNDDVTTCLAVGEGIESTLSLQRLREFGISAVWSLIHAPGIKAFPVLPGLSALWIAVDHDDGGIQASKVCAARYRAAGIETFLVQPKRPKTDLNDFFKVRAAGPGGGVES